MQVRRRACLGDVSFPDLLGLVEMLLCLLQVARVCAGRLECYPQREMHLPQLHMSDEQCSATHYLCIRPSCSGPNNNHIGWVCLSSQDGLLPLLRFVCICKNRDTADIGGRS